MKLWVALFLGCLAVFCFADGRGHRMMTPQWIVETSEKLFLGTRGEREYPIWHLFDRDPRTTWVYRALDYPKPVTKELIDLRGEYWIKLEPSKPILLDEIRIRPGYQKSHERWRSNSRPVQVKIFDQYPWEPSLSFGRKLSTPLRVVDLTDRMEEKSIWLPKKKYSVIYVLISKISRGRIDDLCISELMPRQGGQDAIRPLTTFIHSEGTECGCHELQWLMNSSGQKLASADNEYPITEYRPDGQYVAGIKYLERGSRIWVADTDTGRMVWSGRAPKNAYINGLTWVGKREISATYSVYEGRTRDSSGFERKGVLSGKW